MPADIPPDHVRLWLQSLPAHDRAMAMVLYAERVLRAGDDDAVLALEPLIDEADRLSLEVVEARRGPHRPINANRLQATLDGLLRTGWSNA